MTDKTDEQVVVEWMGWDFELWIGPLLTWRVREVERKLADDLEMLNDYVGNLTGMSGEWTTSDWKDYMLSTDAQRVKAAAETIRGMGR